MKPMELPFAGAAVMMVPIKNLEVIKDYNIRDNLGDIHAGALRIRHQGVETPLKVRKLESGKYGILAGHRRYASATLAAELIGKEEATARIDENKELLKDLAAQLVRVLNLPCLEEPGNWTDLDRNLDLLLSNDGQPLTILEEAKVFERLMKDNGISEGDLMRRTGRSRTHFNNCFLLLNGACVELLDRVRVGKIAGSLAIEMVRKQPDKAEQKRMVEFAEKQADAAGRETITAKHLNETDREKVAPSKKGKRNGGGSGSGGGGTPSLVPSTPAPPATPAENWKLTALKTIDLKFPSKLGVAARILLAVPVGEKSGEKRGLIHAVQIKFAGNKSFTGNELDPKSGNKAGNCLPESVTFDALCELKDDLLAAKRSTEKANTKVKWDEAIKFLDKKLDAAKKAMEKASDKHAAATRKAAAAADPGESLVPEDTQKPILHIVALRDKLKAKKGGSESDRWKTLNFVADYLTGRYKPAAFEKFITEFLSKKDNK